MEGSSVQVLRLLTAWWPSGSMQKVGEQLGGSASGHLR